MFFSLKGIDLKNGACLRDPFIKAVRTPSSCAVFWDPSLNGLFEIIPVCSHMSVLLSPIWLKDTLWQELGSLCRLGSSQRTAEPCWTMNRSWAANYSWDWCSAPRTEPLPLFFLLLGPFLFLLSPFWFPLRQSFQLPHWGLSSTQTYLSPGGTALGARSHTVSDGRRSGGRRTPERKWSHISCCA